MTGDRIDQPSLNTTETSRRNLLGEEKDQAKKPQNRDNWSVNMKFWLYARKGLPATIRLRHGLRHD
jgi:hypothetical protein